MLIFCEFTQRDSIATLQNDNDACQARSPDRNAVESNGSKEATKNRNSAFPSGGRCQRSWRMRCLNYPFFNSSPDNWRLDGRSKPLRLTSFACTLSTNENPSACSAPLSPRRQPFCRFATFSLAGKSPFTKEAVFECQCVPYKVGN